MRWRAIHKVTGKLWRPKKGSGERLLLSPKGVVFMDDKSDFYTTLQELEDYEAVDVDNDNTTIVVKDKLRMVVHRRPRCSFRPDTHDKLFLLSVQHGDGSISLVANASSTKGMYAQLNSALIPTGVLIRKNLVKVVESDCCIHA